MKFELSGQARKNPINSPPGILVSFVRRFGIRKKGNRVTTPQLRPMANIQTLLDLGFRVFPCAPNRKQPHFSGWQEGASSDQAMIDRWCDAMPDANVGVPTGAANRVFVLDIDTKNGVNGLETLAKLKVDFGPLPDTLTASTPSGGRHLYFRYPDNTSIGNRVAFKPGLDVRGDGGFVVAPPSSIDGNPYTWLDSSQSIAEAPEWLLTEIAHKTPRAKLPDSCVADGFPEGFRNDSLFRLICSRVAAGYRREDTEWLALEAAKNCQPAYPADQVMAMVDRLYQRYAPSRPLTDLGNSERFLDTFGDVLKYVPELTSWMIWNETRWELDGGTQISELAKTCIRSIADEALHEKDHEKCAQIRRHARLGEKPQAIRNMLELASSSPTVVTHARFLDADKSLVGVENGFVDLKSGALLPPDRRPLVTMSLGTSWDPEAECPNWLVFLDDLFGADPEMLDFFRTAVGYTLYGGNPEHLVFILYGSGANGKSTFLRVLQSLLGSYAKSVSGSLLMVNRDSNTGGPREDLIRLKGARLIVSPELGEGQMVNEELLKRMTGDDVMVARAPYAKRSVEFIPDFTPWISTNYKPLVRGDGEAIWRRLVLVPFEKQIPREQRDSELGNRLVAELPGILNWALAGFRQWKQNERLELPQAIIEATKDYRDEMDLLDGWLAKCCSQSPGHWTSTVELYTSYGDWCLTEKETLVLAKGPFARKLSGKGFRPRKRSDQRGFEGLRVAERSSWPTAGEAA